MSKISEILIREFKRNKRANTIIDFSEAKKAREELLKFNSGMSKIGEGYGMDPSHKVYAQIQNILSYFAEEVSGLNEFTEYYRTLEQLDSTIKIYT